MRSDGPSVTPERRAVASAHLAPVAAAVIADVLEVDVADLRPHLELDSLAVLEVLVALGDEGLLPDDLGDIAEIPELQDIAALTAFLQPRSPLGA